MTDAARVPVSDLDFWADEVIADPYPHYRALRDLGPAVWLSRYGSWALVHHRSVREALLDAKTFSSSSGIASNDEANQVSKGVMIFADDPEHLRLRRVFTRPLMPAALKALKDDLSSLAEGRVDALIAKGEFDGVTELAHYLPLTVVTELLGLSREGKDNMLAWAAGLFNALGPAGNPRTISGIEIGRQAFAYLYGLDRAALDPSGWGAALLRAADDGDLSHDEARAMLMDYTGPALDTTINGLSSALWLFARHPQQWDLLRSNPQLVGRAIDEALRIESPVRAFARLLTRDYEIDGALLRQGDRALMVYASANRDERRYPDPDRFDISRDARDHVAFGYGTHICAGMHLARLEIATVLDILVRRVKRFHIVEEHRDIHNTLRGLATLRLRVETE